MPTYFVPFIMFIVLFVILRSRQHIIGQKIMKKNTKEETAKMVELAKRFIGKDCLIYAFDSGHQFEGIIKEVSDSAVLIEKNGEMEAINLDFVIRIREFPKGKNGKKKSVVLD